MKTTPSLEKKTPRGASFVPAAMSERRGLLDTSAAAGIPALPVLGVFPLRRFIPQDLHSVLDYQASVSVLGAGLLARPGIARTAGVVLGMAGLGVSLFTDYRLSLRKLIPIEVHEVVGDYLWSLTVMAAPFVLGYARRNRWTAGVNLAVGVTTILGALFTDYRAQRRVQWGRGSPTDLGPVGA